MYICAYICICIYIYIYLTWARPPHTHPPTPGSPARPAGRAGGRAHVRYMFMQMHMHRYAYMHMNMQKGPNMRGWDFVPNVDVKKCQKMYFLIKNGPSGRFPRCKMASKYIPDQFPTIPHQYPYQKHPNRQKSTKIGEKSGNSSKNIFFLLWPGGWPRLAHDRCWG